MSTYYAENRLNFKAIGSRKLLKEKSGCCDLTLFSSHAYFSYKLKVLFRDLPYHALHMGCCRWKPPTQPPTQAVQDKEPNVQGLHLARSGC